MKILFISLTLLLLVGEAASHLWFRQSSPDFKGIVGKRELHATDLKGQRSADVLQFDQGLSYSSERGGQVNLMVLTWHPGNAHGLMDAFGHSPEVCLPLSGARLLDRLPSRELEVGGHLFSVERWLFAHPISKQPLHAYKFAHSGTLSWYL